VQSACGARRPVAVTTKKACGESSLHVLEPNGRHCRGATTRRKVTSTGCAWSASPSVRRELAANTKPPPTLPPVVQSQASVQESPPAPGPAD